MHSRKRNTTIALYAQERTSTYQKCREESCMPSVQQGATNMQHRMKFRHECRCLKLPFPFLNVSSPRDVAPEAAYGPSDGV